MPGPPQPQTATSDRTQEQWGERIAKPLQSLALRLGLTPTRFSRAASAVVLVFLASVPAASALSLVDGRSVEDFAQYYMGGLMVVQGDAQALYPKPEAGATGNAGWAHHSRMRPAYREAAEARHIAEENRFIQVPMMALLFAPLALMPYGWALALWQGAMVFFCWRVACACGRLYSMLSGRPGYTAGLLILVAGVSPLMYRTLRTGTQISPLVAYLITLGMLALWRRRECQAAGAVLISGLAKYAGFIVVPLALLRRQWRATIGVVVGLVGLTVATLVVIGFEPFYIFAKQIAPTLGRPSSVALNQSLPAFALRILDVKQLPAPLAYALRGAGLGVMASVLVLLWRRRRALQLCFSCHLAAGGALILTLLIFSPINWPHYFLYIVPLWAWLAWEAKQRWRLWPVVALIIAAMWLPLCAVRGGQLPIPEPLMSHMLLAAIAMLALSVWRLYHAPPSNENQPE